jgi:alpha-tubulin suppressor-like RCC1 family protein
VLIVACGLYHTACLVDNFEVYTWGNNFQGQLGTPKGILTKKRPRPEAIKELRGRVCNFIACGSNNTMALTETGDMWGWGNNAYYKNGVDEVLTAPERLSLGKDHMKPFNYTQTFAEQFHTLGEPRQILISVRLANDYTMGYTDKGNYYVWGKYWGRKGINYSEYDANKNSGKFWGLFKLDLDMSSAPDMECLDLSRNIIAPELNTSGLGNKKSKMDQGLTQDRSGIDVTKPSGVGRDEYRDPESSNDVDQFTRVACGENFSLAMTIKGRVFVWGSNAYSEHGTDAEYIIKEYDK